MTQADTLMNTLEQLKQVTTVVADTGDIDSIAQFRPQDATTNPSLIYRAAMMERYESLVAEALAETSSTAGDGRARLDGVIDQLSVLFGVKILELIPGRVSTEVDARLSFDTTATIEKARQLIGLFDKRGITRERVLIKIAATWEGICAAERLEQEGIHCNLTLLFGFGQAVACAEARVTLVSPFVGRIFDWHKRDRGVEDIPLEEDPGVASVSSIYNYYKKFDYKTEVMGASFRKMGQITELAGCDLLTISPGLLDELQADSGPLPRKLDPTVAAGMDLERVEMDEPRFRWMLNDDAMANEKLAEGIRSFTGDLLKLRELLAERVRA
jgi:transaldolase